MGLPVQAVGRDVGSGTLQFPLNADLQDDDAGRPDDAPPIAADQMTAAERDQSFAELAERHAQFMFRVAHGLLRSVQDAEDAVQEALLRLYRTGGWQHMQDEKAFLARTVWRVGLDVIERRPKSTEP